MKIIFLCGSLEPGRDGVGDYVRRLACELIKHGLEVAAVALFERELIFEKQEKQYCEDISFCALRLPSRLPVNKRFLLTKEYIDNINPDRISLQYVPYSFQNKGLPFWLPEFLQKLNGESKWHIMFHELWIGFTKISPLKHKITGYFQRNILLRVIKKTKPDLITCTNGLYQSILMHYYVRSEILSLFSNIPLAQPNALTKEKILRVLAVEEDELHEWHFTGIFGNLHDSNRIEKIIENQWQEAKQKCKKLAIVGVGKLDAGGTKAFKQLEQIFTNRIKFIHLGEQSPECVSNLLQMLHAAISSTPSQHIGKSGAYAALRLHNINVIIPDGEIVPEYNAAIKKYNTELLKRPQEAWSAAFIAERFLKLLHPDHSLINCYD
jgi:hypothetical protein